MSIEPVTEISHWFPPDEFAARRETIYDRIGPDAHALVQGAGPVRGFEVFRQSNEFLYLCGVEIPQSYLLLEGKSRTASIFLPRKPERGESETLTADDADLIGEETGLDEVFGIETLAERLKSVC